MKTTRVQVREAAKRSGMPVHTYEVRFSGPWSRETPTIVEAHTIAAALRVAEAENPGKHLGQVVKVA